MKNKKVKSIYRILMAAIMLLSFSVNISAQNNPEEELKKVISTFFKGLQNGDTLTLKSTLAENVILQTAYNSKEGKSILRTDDINKVLNSIANKKPEDIWEEKLLSYNIQVDGNMANVWTPYEFFLNNDFSHCGVNSFQLFLQDNQWKIIYLIDTRRRKGCKRD